MHRVGEIQRFLSMALECSVYIEPADPGLTYEELLEASRHAGFKAGETDDAFRNYRASFRENERQRMLPALHDAMMLLGFHHAQDPDFRNFDAFEFVLSALRHEVQEAGESKARIERATLVQRGVDKGMKRHDLEVAVTSYVLGDVLAKDGGLLGFKPGKARWGLPSDRVAGGHRSSISVPLRTQAYRIVKDIVERRSDGRPASAEPLAAFAEQLDKLGYGHFRMWWVQMLGELDRSSAVASPVTTCVLAAALVEGALTFVVRHARATNLGPMGSTDFEGKPKGWKIEKLIESAARGNADPILDNNARLRADTLVQTRQRIHAGRMLEEYPGGVPDLRPEEARDARATAELVVRRILDWLERHPPG